MLAAPPLWGGGFLVAFGQLAVFYYALGATLHWVLPALLGTRLRGIQEQARGRGEVARDALNSLGPLAVKAGMWTIVEQLHARGWARLYAGPITSATQVAYLLACILVLDVLHDAWFYWTHRLLHWRPLYRWVHWEHHRSTAPSAFTGYAFHVVEAVLVFTNEVLVCWLLPLHMGLHRLYHILTTVIHEAGHVGYELSPFIPTLEGLAALAACGLGGSRALNTVQHHDMHHRHPTRHFSLYFTHWDRWCGTLHPKYDATLFSYFGGGDGAAAGAGAAGHYAAVAGAAGGGCDAGGGGKAARGGVRPAAAPIMVCARGGWASDGSCGDCDCSDGSSGLDSSGLDSSSSSSSDTSTNGGADGVRLRCTSPGVSPAGGAPLTAAMPAA